MLALIYRIDIRLYEAAVRALLCCRTVIRSRRSTIDNSGMVGQPDIKQRATGYIGRYVDMN